MKKTKKKTVAIAVEGLVIPMLTSWWNGKGWCVGGELLKDSFQRCLSFLFCFVLKTPVVYKHFICLKFEEIG